MRGEEGQSGDSGRTMMKIHASRVLGYDHKSGPDKKADGEDCGTHPLEAKTQMGILVESVFDKVRTLFSSTRLVCMKEWATLISGLGLIQTDITTFDSTSIASYVVNIEGKTISLHAYGVWIVGLDSHGESSSILFKCGANPFCDPWGRSEGMGWEEGGMGRFGE